MACMLRHRSSVMRDAVCPVLGPAGHFDEFPSATESVLWCCLSTVGPSELGCRTGCVLPFTCCFPFPFPEGSCCFPKPVGGFPPPLPTAPLFFLEAFDACNERLPSLASSTYSVSEYSSSAISQRFRALSPFIWQYHGVSSSTTDPGGSRRHLLHISHCAHTSSSMVGAAAACGKAPGDWLPSVPRFSLLFLPPIPGYQRRRTQVGILLTQQVMDLQMTSIYLQVPTDKPTGFEISRLGHCFLC
mmetsp:Transcript_39573/g.112232  ORF Transcript_39573/g.112232 Transcript_39573/m.112232 type:complete len:244 (-) Transcript_39573:637-1368(-)